MCVFGVKCSFFCAKCEIEIPIKRAYNKHNSYQQSIVIIYYQILVVRSMNSCKKRKKEMVGSGFRDSSYYDTINDRIYLAFIRLRREEILY